MSAYKSRDQSAGRAAAEHDHDANLEDMPPVLALVVESLIQHFHDLHEVIPKWV